MSYVHTGLAANTTRYYTLAACGDTTPATCSAQSDPSNATTFPAVPGAPTATPTTTAVALSWSAVEGANHYRLYTSNAANGNYAEIPGAAGAGTSYTHSSREPDTTYFYRLAACTTTAMNTCSARSAAVQSTTTPRSTATIATPTGLTATANGVDISITWDSVNTATLYRLYRSIGSGDFTEITAAAGAATAYSDTGLAPNTVVRYQVVACLNMQMDSCSSRSAPVSATTAPAIPPAPNAAITGTDLELSWAGVAGAGYYRLYSANTVNGTYSEIHTGAAMTYTHTGLAPNTTRYYKLAACRDATPTTCSAQSVPGSATTVPAVPAAPTAIPAVTTIALSWSAVDGATHYRLYTSSTMNGSYTEIPGAAGAGTSYTHSGREPDTDYFYRLAACTTTAMNTCSARSAADPRHHHTQEPYCRRHTDRFGCNHKWR